MGREPDILVPSDRDIPRAVNEGKPILVAKPQSEAAQAFRKLAAQLLDGEAPTSARGRRAAASGAASGWGRRWTSTSGSPRRAAATPHRATTDPFAELKNAIHLLVIGDLGVQLFNVEHRSGDAARARARRHPPPPDPGERPLARRARPDHDRARRRHPRPRPARAAARRRHRQRDHGQRPATTSGSSARASSRRRTSGSRTSRTCAASSTRSSPRSAAASTSRRRWSTRASPTAAASTRSSRRSR